MLTQHWMTVCRRPGTKTWKTSGEYQSSSFITQAGLSRQQRHHRTPQRIISHVRVEVAHVGMAGDTPQLRNQGRKVGIGRDAVNHGSETAQIESLDLLEFVGGVSGLELTVCRLEDDRRIRDIQVGCIGHCAGVCDNLYIPVSE